MKYLQGIRGAYNDPRALEELYQVARHSREVAEFTADLEACYAQAPENTLYGAWHYRLQPPAPEGGEASTTFNWLVAIPLSIVGGLIVALTADPKWVLPGHTPYFFLLWAPVAGATIALFLALLAGSSRRRAGIAILTLAAAAVYAAWWGGLGERDYATLMVLHLPLLAAIGVAWTVLGSRPDPQSVFAVLVKSIEVLVTGGVFLIVGGMFAGIGVGMFEALGIRIPPDLFPRLIGLGLGAVPVLAVASVYDPRLRPLEQKFEEGLGRLVPTLTRLLLPLSLLVLAVYVVLIPFRFMEPFRNRDLLIVYNAMLFAVMGLLIGVVPAREEDLAARYHPILRRGVVAVASLAIVVSLYALSATAYRTALGGITVNRLTVIGWNTINIAILGLLVYRQVRDGPAIWIRSLQSVARTGTIGYIVWTVFLIVAIPVLF